MCDSRVGENVALFMVGCGEFERLAGAVRCVQNCEGQRVVG